MLSSFLNFLAATAAMIPLLGPHISPTRVIHNGVKGCVNPAVRREWRTLSTYERSEWIRGVKCLADMPHNSSVIATRHPPLVPPINTSSSYFDDFVHAHMDLGDSVIHLTGLFFPWHRAFVQTLETAMHEHCGYRGVHPYWDWTLDASDFENSAMFADSDPASGLGGWGNPDMDFRVEDGAFSQTSGFALSYPYPHTLRREFTLFPWINWPVDNKWGVVPDQMANTSFTSEAIADIITSFKGDYIGFQSHVENIQSSHFAVHSILGADMSGLCTKNAPKDCASNRLFAPNDPIFYLHHGMVDKIWSDWQNHHPENLNAYSGGRIPATIPENYRKYPAGMPPNLTVEDIMESNGLFEPWSIRDVMSTTGGVLCYVYE